MTTSNTGNTQNLIIAARALAARQRCDFAHHLAVTEAEQKREKASQEIVDAEFGVAKAESALSSARLAKLVAQRRLSTAQLQMQQVAAPLEQARRQLWSVCSSPDEQLIVAAAKTYGECAQNFWLAHEQIDRSRTALATAEASISRAEGDLQVYNTALRLAREAQAAASESFQAAHQGIVYPHQPAGLFTLESEVVDAALALTGSTGMGFAYSYVDTNELPVWQEMEANAKA